MPSGTSSLSVEEIDLLSEAVLSEKIVNRNDTTYIDQIDCPVVDYMLGRTRELGQPTNDGFKFMVAGRRGQRIQWWDGADILTFENRHTLTNMTFHVGRGHMGMELLYQTIERAGIRVDYQRGIREKGAAPKSTLEVVTNIIKNHSEGADYDWKLDLARRFWRANTDQSKAFSGIDALFPATGNTTGTIGGRDRSNPLFRHNLVTGITKSNFMVSFHKLVKQANDYQKKGKVEIFAVGDDVWDLLVDLFSGTDTVAGKFDYRSTRDLAMKKGEKYNVALPQDCFMYEDAIIYREKLFQKELDVEEPTASPIWSKRIYGFNPGHVGIYPVINEVMVNHGMPYNQRLERWSKHGEWVVWTDHPRANFVGVMT